MKFAIDSKRHNYLFEIDGSQKSGSGTILRLAVALSAIRGEALHITNIRQNRPKPGLRPQHLEAVLTAAKLSNAQVEGAVLGSRELWFKPSEICGGTVEARIGTAGSIPMLFMAALPICLHAKKPVQLRVSHGGTDTRHAPTVNYFRHVFLAALKQMGIEAELEVQRYGYYPKGNGAATLTVKPAPQLKPIHLESFGQLQAVKGISVCTFLAERKVAERQAKAATQRLSDSGIKADIQVVNDTSNFVQKGSSLALWAETDKGALLGADSIGELKKTAEAVGVEAAEKLLTELASGATVDTYLADMLIPYIALAKGESAVLTRVYSDHLEANIWLAEKMLGARFNVNRVGAVYRVQKLAETDV
ncbi:MAG: RNA 3'-terminal phosphate cyclase [Candidatus Bathyarchaeota archaeon]|nr:RNA 3'-terminal phosphate cyclase [Candidatus Bathyarchaeota archaeon]